MGRPATLKIDILADAKGVSKGVSEADGKLSKLGSGAAKVGKMLAVGLAVGAAATVVVGRALIQAGERAGTANAAIGNIAKQMDLFGGKTDAVTKRVIAYAEATARQTGVDTNAIKSTQAKLMTFSEIAKTADTMGGSFDRATMAAVDLAAAGFGTAESNAVQLGKALNDPIKGLTSLSKSGVTFTESEKKRIETLVKSNKVGEAQALILSAIEKQVGGTAKATANGSDRMKVAFEQVKERLGLRLMPVFDAFATFVAGTLLPIAERLAGQLATKLGPAFTAVGAFVTGTVMPAFRALSGEASGNTTSKLSALGAFIRGNVLPVLAALSGFVTGTLVPAVVRLATPVIGALKGALASVGQTIDANRAQLATLGNAVLTVAKVIGPLASVVGTVLAAAFRVAGGAISAIVSILASVVRAAERAADAIRAVAKVASSVGSVVGKLNPFSAVPLVGHGVPLVGGYATGPALGPLTTASLGDGGLALLSRSPNAAAVNVVDRRSFPTTINVDGALDPVAVARQLEGILRDQAMRLGRTSVYGAA
jgi:hypothetical protein